MEYKVTERFLTNTDKFTSGRPGWNGAPFIVLHTYNGVGTSLFNYFNTPADQGGSPGTSSTFDIQKDGTIEQLVRLDDTPHANGDGWANANSVTIEFQDDGRPSDPNTYTKEQIEAYAWLFVNVINPWASGRIANNEAGVTPHFKWTNTGCPGALWGRRQELYDAVNRLIAEKDWKNELEDIADLTFKIQKDINLVDLNNGTVIKTFKKGEEISVGYKYGNFYLTNYSVSTNSKTGFSIDDLTYIEPEPTPNYEAIVAELKAKNLELITENTGLKAQNVLMVNSSNTMSLKLSAITQEMELVIEENTDLNDKQAQFENSLFYILWKISKSIYGKFRSDSTANASGGTGDSPVNP